MFEGLISSVPQKITRNTEGRLTKDRILEIAAQESFLGSMFKSKEEKIADLRKEALAKLSGKVSKVNDWLTKDIDEAEMRIEAYLKHTKSIADDIRGKKFIKSKFDTLAATSMIPKYHVLYSALFQMNDLHRYLDQKVAWLTGQSSRDPDDEHGNIHDLNSAYLSGAGEIDTPFDYLSGRDELVYYAIHEGDLLKNAEFPDDFVHRITSSSGQVVSSIKSLIGKRSYLDRVESFVKSIINKPSTSPKDYAKSVHFHEGSYESMAWFLGGSIRSSSWYLHEATKAAYLIAHHCYE